MAIRTPFQRRTAPRRMSIAPEISDEDKAVVLSTPLGFSKLSVTSEEEEDAETATHHPVHFTATELKDRKEQRLAMSGHCVHETWKAIKKMTVDAWDEDDLRRWGVLYDPTIEKRRKVFNERNRSSLDTFAMLKEAPACPYIRAQRPKRIDVPGKHSRQPSIVKATMTEAESKENPIPTTNTPTNRWISVSNVNFPGEEVFLDKETQTDFTILRSQTSLTFQRSASGLRTIAPTGVSTSTTQTKNAPISTALDLEAEFDLEDIPLDDQGNPIGKSTGYCEWCGNAILPIPTAEDEHNASDVNELYCCNKYREFLTEVAAIAKQLQEEHDRKNFFIDIRPHSKHKLSEAEKRAANKAAAVRAKLDYGLWQQAVSRGNDRSADPKDRKKWLKNYQATHTFGDKAVSTYDLPWDPYESYFKVPYRFNDEIFDYGVFHRWKDAWIYARQSEIFIPTCGELTAKLPPAQKQHKSK